MRSIDVVGAELFELFSKLPWSGPIILNRATHLARTSLIQVRGQFPQEGEEPRHQIWGPTFNKFSGLQTLWMKRNIHRRDGTSMGRCILSMGICPRDECDDTIGRCPPDGYSSYYEYDRMAMDIHTPLV